MGVRSRRGNRTARTNSRKVGEPSPLNCDLLITEIQAKVLGQCEYFRILMAGAWMRENVVGGWRFFFGGKCGERVGFYVFLVIFVD